MSPLAKITTRTLLAKMQNANLGRGYDPVLLAVKVFMICMDVSEVHV